MGATISGPEIAGSQRSGSGSGNWSATSWLFPGAGGKDGKDGKEAHTNGDGAGKGGEASGDDDGKVDGDGEQVDVNDVSEEQDKPVADDEVEIGAKDEDDKENKWLFWKPEIFGDLFMRRVFKPLPPKEEAMSLFQDYFENFNCMFPLFHEPTFMHLVEKQYSDDAYESSSWWACINIAFVDFGQEIFCVRCCDQGGVLLPHVVLALICVVADAPDHKTGKRVHETSRLHFKTDRMDILISEPVQHVVSLAIVLDQTSGGYAIDLLGRYACGSSSLPVLLPASITLLSI